jgi:ribosomal subunit interface protein
MNLPLEISARNVKLGDETEELIREKAAKLDRVYDRIIGCRVRLDLPHRSQKSGMTFNVRIDVTVPGSEIVVKRELDGDLHAAITSSFDAAQRQLKEYVEKQRGDVKIHVEKPEARISKLFADDGYGFLETADGREIYFHENAVLNGRFKELRVGSAVTFIERAGNEGPQASSVSIS